MTKDVVDRLTTFKSPDAVSADTLLLKCDPLIGLLRPKGGRLLAPDVAGILKWCVDVSGTVSVKDCQLLHVKELRPHLKLLV
ncbi:hypothetical protein PPYR_11610 [Photinus pyralis]|uniref:Uncharacterized protein n=1 Tax=Photinus pyralis TaxID=7054 RepID=A0A5N4ABT2_PHOPY|nr:hypothetical protein PPYR_11610 [Photinus pyralis]